MRLVIDKLDDVAEPLRQEYEARDGRFHLKIDGDPAKEFAPLVAANAKIAEFRTTNVALLKERTDLTAKLAAANATAVDPEEVVKLKLKLAEAESATAAATQRHDALVFRQAVTTEALAMGAHAEALDLLVSKAPFKSVDGELKPNDPAVPTLKDWLEDQIAGPLAFAFKPTTGGNARGSKPGAVLALGGRTDVKQLINPTPQELGKHSADIAAGRAKVVYTT